jgi:hypothetical protein
MATAKEKVRSVKLRAVGQAAAKHRKAKDAATKARDEVDKTILAARKAGGTYREIAAEAGVSTAWVQDALERSGYKPQPR